MRDYYMSEIRLFEFNQREVRVVLRNGEPWWVATDIAKVLDYKDPSKMLNLVESCDKDNVNPREETANLAESLPSNVFRLSVVNEAGLYSCIFGSHKPEAKAFKKYVFEVILPSIRKTGSYSIQENREKLEVAYQPKPEFKGQKFCVLTDGSTELTYNKGRWFAHFPVEYEVTSKVTNKVIALDPGVRTFITGFDGSDFLEFGNGDFSKIAKLCSHLDKLRSRHDKSKGHSFKRLRYKLRQSMERIRTRIKNLRSECHKQVASYLAKNYDIVVLPTFETSEERSGS